MARPRKEGMEYFPHDSYAVNDKKIEALRMLYGNDGYAFYFILLETIYQEPNFELDISDAETIQILVRKTSVTEQKFNSMLETSLKRDCFDRESYENRQVLTSNGIKKRATVVTEKRVKMQESYASKGKKVSDPISDAETTPETPQSKRKVKDKVIVKDIKISYAEFVDMTEIEYQKLVEAHGIDFTKKCIEELDNHKGAKGQTYKSDYRAILKWVVGKVKEDIEKAKMASQGERKFRHTEKIVAISHFIPSEEELKHAAQAYAKQSGLQAANNE